MNKLFVSLIGHSKEYREIKNSVGEGVSPLYVYGTEPEYSAIIASSISSENGGIIITPSEPDAKRLYDSVQAMDENILMLPNRDLEFFDVFAESHSISSQRAHVMNRLMGGDKVTIVASIDSVLRALPPPGDRKKSIRISYGDSQPMHTLVENLVAMGFERVDMVESPGHISVRGGILDCFPIESENPVRIEFFGDEIDSVREFDVTNQISVGNIKGIEIFPCFETTISDVDAQAIAGRLKEVLAGRSGAISDRLRETISLVIDRVESGMDISDSLDRFIPLLYDKENTILDYLGKNAVVSFIDPSRISERAESFHKDFIGRFSDHFEKGNALAEEERRIVDFTNLRMSLSGNPVLMFDMIKKDVKVMRPAEIVHFSAIDPPNYLSRIDALKEDVETWKYRGFKILIAISDEEKSRRMRDSLLELGTAVTLHASDHANADIVSGQCVITTVNISKGAVFSSFKTVVLTDSEIFGAGFTKKVKRRTAKERVIRSFNELSEGDLVVHEAHGIGRYVGMKELNIDGSRKDYLKIDYAGDDCLYIPVEQMDILQKYIGGASDTAKLSRLGGIEWKKAKSKARKSIEDITDDLIKLYAERRKVKGHQFSADTEWQREFEDAFPYVETPDQLRCIDEIKEDMEKPDPMDRLLCGDVGFGKTEVAMRAIFKAVSDSKQAAVLVPTTILAQQHYSNMVDRFSKFPLKIEMLSRFRTKKQQEKIIQDLKDGVIDIIIGTHRVVSDDVKFKNLGLLVIDEEQRFGVKHKEAIKKLKVGVDVLTMTATPIPRTLHMSLSGIRDMSVIEDPPEDRFPIQTYVAEYGEDVITEAILREVGRGGQVYFVHNVVSDIDVVTSRLRHLLPDMDIRYAHGQMSEVKLEKLMLGFMNREFDVLVATTIIETGLDISNANTIIINDADRMGLSQLYQLRGRVGRSSRIAYAYLLYKKDKALNEISEKRLKAIKEFTELGAGFRIAMRDLELRGSGNVLGAEQSGHMASVGYELYSQMIEEAVNAIKGEPPKKEHVDTLIELSVDAYIPDSLIPVHEHKLDMYKRISSIRAKNDVVRVEEEIEDRYGDVPKCVYNLIKVAYARAMGQRISLLSISEDEKGIVGRLAPDAPITPEIIEGMHKKYGMLFRLVPGAKPYFRLAADKKGKKGTDILNETVILLESILSFL